jgi:hypothetical protein
MGSSLANAASIRTTVTLMATMSADVGSSFYPSSKSVQRRKSGISRSKMKAPIIGGASLPLN